MKNTKVQRKQKVHFEQYDRHTNYSSRMQTTTEYTYNTSIRSGITLQNHSGGGIIEGWIRRASLKNK